MTFLIGLNVFDEPQTTRRGSVYAVKWRDERTEGVLLSGFFIASSFTGRSKQLKARNIEVYEGKGHSLIKQS